MRAVVQRVKSAGVTIEGRETGKIQNGLLVFLGIEDADGQADIDYMCDKITGLRIFEDAEQKMNLSVLDVLGEVLLISQFTLYGDARKGKRPGFTGAARPEKAIPIYEELIARLKAIVPVQTGEFGADMQVSLINDGPVTILLESKRLF